MRLSDIENAVGMAVRRDGDFQTLGFLSDTCPYQLVFLESRTFVRALQRNRSVSAVLTTAGLMDAVPRNVALAICDEPRTVFARLHNELAIRGFYWDDFPAIIDSSAKIHPTAWMD
jgi:UDP-3-O-[3-hydroxymyristoyl] glucosamine N-acyltransferase